MILLQRFEQPTPGPSRHFRFTSFQEHTAIAIAFLVVRSASHLRVRTRRPTNPTILAAINTLAATPDLATLECHSPSPLTRRLRLALQGPDNLIIEASHLAPGTTPFPAADHHIRHCLGQFSQPLIPS